MLVVRATKRLRDRLGPSTLRPDDACTTGLGTWYAELLEWRRPLVLLVNETTLLPAVLPLGRASGLLRRIPQAITDVLAEHGVPGWVIEDEASRMDEVRFGPTANRSVVGVMVEFAGLAEAYPAPQDLVGLALWLAEVPCRPLFKRHIRPGRELAALFNLPNRR